MTIPILLTLTLQRIHKEFYQHRSHEFHRDYIALTKALARYGAECAQRSWHLEPRAIYADIHNLLTRILPRRDQIEYLPVYLDHAIRSHVNLRAEEIREKAIRTGVQRKVETVLEGTKLVAKVIPTDVELLAQLRASLQRKPHAKAKPKPEPIQQYELAL